MHYSFTISEIMILLCYNCALKVNDPISQNGDFYSNDGSSFKNSLFQNLS